MTFTRLSRGELLAMVAALALLLVMATDWYTTKRGELARDAQSKILPQVNRETVPSESTKQGEFADTQEKNAWQADGLIDRLILIALVAAVALALAAAWAKAAGKSLGPPSPSALASLVGLIACLLLVYRILQPPGQNAAAVVKVGAPLGLLCAGLLTLGARVASRGDSARTG
jgi:purine-cytosine permease-like protein